MEPCSSEVFAEMEQSFPPESGLPWAFSDKEVTAWGGLRLVQELLVRLNFREALRAAELPPPGSNRGFDPVTMMEAFLVCVWIGGARFSHTSLVRFDTAIHGIFGWRGVGSVSTFTRFFRRFKREEVDRVFSHLNRWFWSQLTPRTLTVDLDSSVITRFGEQEGVAVGYNKDRGKASHNPLFAFVADLRMVLHAWLRPGNTVSGNGVATFFKEAQAQLAPGHRIGLVRADSGFYVGDFLEDLDAQGISYIVVARKFRPLQMAMQGLTQWTTLEEGVEVAELEYEPKSWHWPGRYVVVRQDKKRRPEAYGRMLIDVPGYAYQALISNLDLPPGEIWRLYNGRADSENRIAELKHDFGLNGFCLESFYATEAAFRSVIVAYNLMSYFRQAILKAPQAVRLFTMRFQCFALGAWIGGKGRRRLLRISLPPERRPWFEGIFAKASRFSPPWPRGSPA